jgi:hypothetical protein
MQRISNLKLILNMKIFLPLRVVLLQVCTAAAGYDYSADFVVAGAGDDVLAVVAAEVDYNQVEFAMATLR